MNLRQLTVPLCLTAILVAGTTLTNRQSLRAAFPDDAGLPPTASSLLKFLDRIEITTETVPGKLITTLVNDNPKKFVWTGQQDGRLFAAAVRRLPRGSIRKQAAPVLMGYVQAKMVSEVLKTKAILDTYTKHGLTETDSLREAVERAAGQLNLSGSLKGFLSKASIEEGCAVGYLVVDEANVIAHLEQKSEINKVRGAYQLVLHARMRNRMKQEQWTGALETWSHLHGLTLVSQELVLDATICTFKLGDEGKTLEMIGFFMKKYQDKPKPRILEEMGNIAIEIETADGQETAELAYNAAIEQRMGYTTKRYTPLLELP